MEKLAETEFDAADQLSTNARGDRRRLRHQGHRRGGPLPRTGDTPRSYSRAAVGRTTEQHTPEAAGRTKVIDVAYHLVRHRVLQGDIEAVCVKTEDMKADMLTKAVPGLREEAGAEGMGLGVLW